MKKSQNNYLKMAQTVCGVFYKITLWNGIELIEKCFERIVNLVNKIGEIAMEQQKNRTSGYTEKKDQERDLLENCIWLIATRLSVYARINSDSVLAAQVDFSQSLLGSLPLNSLLAIARTITVSCREHAGKLEQYMITQTVIDDMERLMVSTEELEAFRDTVRSEHTENTAHLVMLFDSLRSELKLMDKQVEAFISDEEFRRTYFIARRLHDVRRGSSRKHEDGEE